VLDQTFDLFDKLGATDDQLDFAVVYASALSGYSSLDADDKNGDMSPLLSTIISESPAPVVDLDGPFQMQISSLGYDPYIGVLGTGRIQRGEIRSNTPIAISSEGNAK
jgi:GTP-binding protein